MAHSNSLSSLVVGVSPQVTHALGPQPRDGGTGIGDPRTLLPDDPDNEFCMFLGTTDKFRNVHVTALFTHFESIFCRQTNQTVYVSK